MNATGNEKPNYKKLFIVQNCIWRQTCLPTTALLIGDFLGDVKTEAGNNGCFNMYLFAGSVLG